MCRYTAKSFTDLVENISTTSNVKVFRSQQICEDPLENLVLFFLGGGGCQQQCGGTHGNSSVQEFQKNMQDLKVANNLSTKKGTMFGTWCH